MALRRVRLTHACLSLALIPCAAIAHADTTLVGTTFTNTQPSPTLCPRVNDCTVGLSGFSTPVPFTLTSVQLSLSGPAVPGGGPEAPASKSADFQAYLLTSLNQAEHFTQPFSGPPVIGGTKLGSGTLTYSGDPEENQGDVSEAVTLSGLDVSLQPGQQYWLEVLGGDMLWNSETPLMNTLGTFGLQLTCDPYQNCGRSDPNEYDHFYGTLGMELSGTPAATPEPETWCLLATGLALLGAARLTMRQRALGNLPTAL